MKNEVKSFNIHYFYKLSFYLWYVWMNKMLSVYLEPYVEQCIVTQV